MNLDQYDRREEGRTSLVRRWIVGSTNFVRQFTFKREFDLTSLAAFVLSVVVAMLTLGPRFASPEIKLTAPLTAILFAEDYNGAEATFDLRQPQIRFVVDMSFANLAAVGIQAIVAKQSVDFTLGSTTYHQEWRYATATDTERYHVHLCPDEPVLKKLRDTSGPLTGYRYDEKTVSERAPVVFGCHSKLRKLILWERRPLQRIVPGNSAVAQQVVFEGPGTGGKILPAKEFSSFLARTKSVEPTLKITIHEASGATTSITCRFAIVENDRLLFEDRGWFTIDQFKCS